MSKIFKYTSISKYLGLACPNLLGPVFELEEGVVQIYSNTINNEVSSLLDVPGIFSSSPYQVLYYKAHLDLDCLLRNKVTSNSIYNFFSLVTFGCSAVDALLNDYIKRMEIDLHGNLPHYKNIKNYRDWEWLNYKEKIESFGKHPFYIDFPDINEEVLSNANEIKKYRDDMIVHNKNTSLAISYRKLEDLINKFVRGVSTLLYGLHIPSNFICPFSPPDYLVQDCNLSDVRICEC